MKRAVCVVAFALGAGAGSARAVDLAAEQQSIGAAYTRLESALTRVCDELATRDPQRADQLRSVVRGARSASIAGRFGQVTGDLERARLAAAKRGQETLTRDLHTLLERLSEEPRAALLSRRAEWADKLLAEVRAIERAQRELRSATEAADAPAESAADEARADASATAESQQRLADRTARAANAAADDPMGSAPGEKSSAAEPLRDAVDRMRSAAEKAEGNSPESAERSQTDALEALAEARRRLDEVLRQVREEEQQRRLVSLAERFRQMLEQQRPLNDSTVLLADESGAIDRVRRARFSDLATRQSGVVESLDAALRLVEAADRSVAFAFALDEARRLLHAAARGLADFEADHAILVKQQDATRMLADLSDAVEQEVVERRADSSGDGSTASQQADPELSTRIADLKVLRRLQQQLLERSESVTGDEARRLRRRQARVADATRDLVERAP